jgi:hypothetical protein
VSSKYPQGERAFNEWLVEEYLKHGSVDETFQKHRWNIPISYAGYQRVLDKWGIIKASGPNSKLTEVLEFLTRLAEKNIPFEKLYAKTPPSFRTSSATLYRVLSYIKEGMTRRMGTGLVITPHNNHRQVLVGRDVSKPRPEFGKPFGSISMPVGFSRKRDSREDAILRVLQQEVFTKHAIKKNMPNIIPVRPKPFMFLDVADVRVEVFHIKLPKRYSRKSNFSSFKLQDFRFLPLSKMTIDSTKLSLRSGVRETARGYKKYLELKEEGFEVNPVLRRSQLNRLLIQTEPV